MLDAMQARRIEQTATTPLKLARVAFTGKLASMAHREAHQFFADAGGKAANNVSRMISILVVGMEGWPLLSDGKLSWKLRHAEQLQRQGHIIQIIAEATFLEMLGLKQRRAQLNKTQSPEQVCELLQITPKRLARWEQFDLIKAHNGMYDFQDYGITTDHLCPD